MINDNVYVAKVRAIVDGDETKGQLETSDVLDVFLVYPIRFLGFGHIIGFKELITNDKVIKRYELSDSLGHFFRHDYDFGTNDFLLGGIKWEVIERASANKIVEKEFLENYISQTPEDIRKKLSSLRTQAKDMVVKEDPRSLR